jgi:hypothetical protein
MKQYSVARVTGRGGEDMKQLAKQKRLEVILIAISPLKVMRSDRKKSGPSQSNPRETYSEGADFVSGWDGL